MGFAPQSGMRSSPTGALPAGAITGSKLASDALKFRTVSGRNGAGSMTVSGAVSTDTIVSVQDLTGGADVTADFNAITTGGLTQTTSTNYSSSKMLVILKPAS